MLLTPLNRDSTNSAAIASTSSKKTTKEVQVCNKQLLIYLTPTLLIGIGMFSGVPRCFEATARW